MQREKTTQTHFCAFVFKRDVGMLPKDFFAEFPRIGERFWKKQVGVRGYIETGKLGLDCSSAPWSGSTGYRVLEGFKNH